MKKPIDLTGLVFGRWTVLGQAGKRDGGKYIWMCRCECGAEKPVFGGSLQRRHSESCGCLRRELAGPRSRTHGLTKTAEYRCWSDMKKRCFYSKHKDFKDYGGRGITVCQRWLDSFEAFLEDMGRKPSPEHSLDRKDVNGNYEPSNCRWATDIEQARNTRATVFIDFRGEKMSLMAACELAGLPWQTVRQRLGLGWPVDRALNQPVQVRKKPRRELVLKGERNGMAKLTAAQVKEIRIAYASKATTHSAIASEYGISRSSVGQIISGKSWSLT